MSTAAARLPPPRHLLVRLPNPVGDAVMATPALRGLRRALPDTRITWTGRPAPHAALAGLDEQRDGVVPIAKPLSEGARGPLRIGKLLRGLDCDAALLLPNSWSSALEAQRARIPTRVGSNLNRRGGLLTEAIDLPVGDDGKLEPRSMVDHYLQLAACFGAVDDGEGPRLATTAYDEERATFRLGGRNADWPLVGINPGAAFGASKCYPPARVAEALAAVRTRSTVDVLVLCGPGEEPLAEALTAEIRGTGGEALSTHESPPDLGELKALLRRCAVLATTDAGPRHVAEAFGVPTVVWMGPTDPRWSGHSGATLVRREDLACLACHEPACPLPDHPCMRALEPARVATGILAQLP